MTPFHPTISVKKFLKIARSSYNQEELEKALNGLFPGYTSTILDSGRSSLSLAIESLGLSGKRIAVPAYLCDVLWTIFRSHNMEVTFLDVSQETFQPEKDAYTKEVLDGIDAVLLVATYGNQIPDGLVANLKSEGKVVIEDFAHVALPYKSSAEIISDARYYSLPKMLPVPDGGILFTKKPIENIPFDKNRVSLKNWLKLFTLPQFIISYLASLKSQGKITRPKSLQEVRLTQAVGFTKKVLANYLNAKEKLVPTREKYCKPELVENPKEAQKKYFKKGIATTRIWRDPIIFASGENRDNFPNTKYISEHILCKPF